MIISKLQFSHLPFEEIALSFSSKDLRQAKTIHSSPIIIVIKAIGGHMESKILKQNLCMILS